MSLLNLWAVAVCEMRSCSRLARTWVFIALAFLVSVVTYVFFCIQHMLVSTLGPSPNVQIPRFVVGESASQFILLFAIGIIFIAFDIRARDVRDRIVGIVDAKPVSNIEFIVGRLSGMLILLGIPIVLFLVLVFLHGALAGLAGWSFGEPIEPWSVFSFLVWDVVPNLAWYGGLIMFLAVLLRNRLLVVIVALGLFALQTWITFRVSLGQLEVMGAVTSQVIHPSDNAPIFASTSIAIQRLGWMLLSVGLLVIAAALLPRQLPRRAHWALAGLGTFVTGILVLVFFFHSQSAHAELKDAWRQVHESQDITSFPNVQHLSGNVLVNPGSRIELELQLTVSPPVRNATENVTFTLNPGYTINSLAIDSRVVTDHTFQDGLLKVPAGYFDSEESIVEIEAIGKPDPRFAYLDERIDLRAAGVTDLNVAMARFLGNQTYVFQPGYVALLAGVSWYPTAGVAVGHDDLRKYPRDHFTVDLTVNVPPKWHVAGPGRAEPQSEDARRTTYRFRPVHPVVNVAVIASKFERISTTVRDIEFELLYSPKHRRTFAAMEPLLPSLRQWVEERLATIEDKYGLNYPYETLTLVEVPAHLRVLGGGWRMDSTLYAPGIVMLRETALPTARFDVQFKDQDGEQSFRQLLSYVDNDLQGGNPFNGIARNFVIHQMSPFGAGAISLNLFIEDLVGELIVDRLPYYTTDTALSIFGLQQVQLASQLDVQQGPGGTTVSASLDLDESPNESAISISGAATMRQLNIHKTGNWSAIEQSALRDLSFEDHPIQFYDAVLLKNTYILLALKDWMGDEALGHMLTGFLREYRGQNYTYEEFVDFATVHEPKFKEVSQDWIQESRMPGFIVSDPSVVQLESSEQNAPVFQTVFDLRNDESIPGVFKVQWTEQQEFGANRNEFTTGHLPTQLIPAQTSYQIAIQSANVPSDITIVAPLSLNRTPIQLRLPYFESAEEVPTVPADPLPNILPIEWNSERQNFVIVDDLDPGFTYTGEPKELDIPGFLSFFVQVGLEAAGGTASYDYGLPVYDRVFDRRQWARVQDSGFGRYRKTFARTSRKIVMPAAIKPDLAARFETDVNTAEFSTTLPRGGDWVLEYSVPGRILVEHFRNNRNVKTTNNDTDSTLALSLQVDGDTILLELNMAELANKLEVSSWASKIDDTVWNIEEMTNLVRKSSSGYQDSYWVELESFEITDPHVVVTVSNENEYPEIFADAIRWTYRGEDGGD